MVIARLWRPFFYCLERGDASKLQQLSLAYFSSYLVSCDKEYTEGPKQGEQLENFPYADVPRPAPRWKRKPYPTPMKVLIRRAKEEKKIRKENPCRVLEHDPENGLLVPDLIKVAYEVYNARELLLHGLSKLVERESAVSIYKCRFCSEVHIGRVGHDIRTCEGCKSGSRSSTHVWRRGGIKDVIGFPYCYHLYDRVGNPRVVHKERFRVKRLPAIAELCIQAGLELEDYPTKRRNKPVYSIEGRIVDFEGEQDNDEAVKIIPPLERHLFKVSFKEEMPEEDMAVSELSTITLQSWFKMRSGALKLMQKYSVLTCGYCPEIQVGPKGHKVRMCKATKHQFRDGMHAWQEATIDDLIRPNYVWHVQDPDGPPLANELKRYFGKAPALVELCVQSGAPVPELYRSMMRLDVVPPDRDEHDLVA